MTAVIRRTRVEQAKALWGDLRYNLPMWWVAAVNVLWWVILPHRRFGDVNTIEHLADVPTAHPAMLEELRALRATGTRVPRLHDIEPGQTRVSGDGRWRTFTLKLFGNDVPINQQRCPQTWAAVSQVPGLRSAMFSVLEPHARIPSHMGPTKGLWRYHLAIDVAEPEATGITIAGTTVHWTPGEAFMFDDTYPHHAWNNGTTDRVVLVCDIVRPLRFKWMRRLNMAVLDGIARNARLRNAAAKAGDYTAAK